MTSETTANRSDEADESSVAARAVVLEVPALTPVKTTSTDDTNQTDLNVAHSIPTHPDINIITRCALAFIRIYQHYISPFTPPSCRFHPTCSHYTYQAIERFGFRRGGWLGFCRICRCNPFCASGVDPVPETYPPRLSWRQWWHKVRKRKAGTSTEPV